MQIIRILLSVISFILIIASIFSVAAEYKLDRAKNISELSKYWMPASVAVVFGFKSKEKPYISTSMVDIFAHPDNVEYYVLRVVLEKYSGLGCTAIKTWKNVKSTIDSDGKASFRRTYQVNEPGTYRIRVSGEGYKDSRCVDTFSDRISTATTFRNMHFS